MLRKNRVYKKNRLTLPAKFELRETDDKVDEQWTLYNSTS